MVLKPHLNKAFALKILIITILFCFLVILLFPVRTRVNRLITDRKIEVIEFLEDRLEHKITYSGIAPSILHAFEIRDFTILSADSPDTPLLKISRLRLSYNLFRFNLENPLEAFRGLLLVNTELSIDGNLSPELMETLSKISGDDNGSAIDPTFVKLPADFFIRGRNISFSFKNEGIKVELSRIFFNIVRNENNDLLLSLRAEAAAELTGFSEELPFRELLISTRLGINGRIDSQFEWADLNIDTRNLETSLISSERIAWNLRYEKPGLISLVKTGDNIPVDININTNLSENTLSLALQAQDFIFNRYFETGGFINDYSIYLDSLISGTADIDYNLDNKNIAYSGDLEIFNIKGLLDDPIDISADLKGNNGYIAVNKSSVSSSPGKVNFSGTVELGEKLPIVNGLLDIPGIDYKNISLSSSVTVSSNREGGYTLNAGNTDINGLFIPQLSAKLIPYDDNIEFYIDTNIGSDNRSPGRLYSEGVIQLDEGYYLQASIDIENLLLAPVVDAVPMDLSLPETFENIELTTEMFVSGSLEQLSFASPIIRFIDRENDNRKLSFSLSGNNSGVRLSEIDFKWDNNYLKGYISTDLTNSEALVLQTNLEFNGSSFNVGGVYSREGNLALTGDYNFKLNLFSIGETNNFSLKMERLPINLKEDTSFLSLNVAGFLSSADNWKLLINDISLESIPTGFDSGNLSLAAVLSQNGGNIYRLDYSDSQSQLSGGGSINLDRLQLPVPSGRIQLNIFSETGSENYMLLLGYNGRQVEGDLRFTGFPIKRVAPDSPAEGQLTGSISAVGPLSSPQLRLLLDSENASMNGQHLNINSSIYYEDMVVSVEEISVSLGANTISDISGILNLREGQHSLNGSLSAEGGVFKLTSPIVLDAVTHPIGAISEFNDIPENDIEILLSADDLKINGEKRDSWKVRLEKADEQFNIIGGVRDEIVCNYFGDGYFSLETKTPFPVDISATGTVIDGNINADISDIRYVVNDLILPIMAFYEGDFTGRLKIQGPINDPDFYGQLDFHDVVFTPPFVEDVSVPSSTSFFFSGKELTVPATRVRTNNGLAYVTIEASMERWLPRNYDIRVNVPDGEAISSRLYWSPFYLYGFGDGNLRISGNFSHMYIDGKIMVSDGIFMMNNSLPARPKGKYPIEFITCDLDIVSKENNQFFWPSQEFPIVKGYLSTDNNIKVLFDTIERLELDGDLSLKGGEITYFERSFYLKEGNIGFNKAKMPGIDPILSARAEIRDVSAEGEMTKISLIIDPSPLSSFAPRFESDPPLSTAEIISIIGGNIFNTSAGDGNITLQSLAETGIKAVDMFTQLTIMRNIEDGLKSTLGLDLLSIRSSFLSNFFENTVFSSSRGDNNVNFAEYLDNTTLYLGKYFSDDIFLQGMFQFDLYNDTGYSEGLNINVDSEIKLEWEGPIANVELNLYPDFYDPVEGISRTSLGLSWRFSY